MTTPGAPAPAPVPTPTPPAQDLTSAGDAARQRIDQAFPEGTQPGDLQPGAVAPPAAAPPPTGDAPPAEAPFDIFADNAIEGLDLGNVTYRDGKKLESELVKARDTFKPLNDALSGLDDHSRTALLAALPSLGPDLAMFGSVASQLHPDDRAYFQDAMRLFATDPGAAATELARGADILRRQFTQPATQPAPLPPGQQPMPEWAQGDPEGLGGEGGDQPITRAEFDRMMQERDYATQVAQEESAIVTEAHDLGYDLDSDDPIVSARATTLINLAGRPEIAGDLSKAHVLMQQMDQAAIDDFVKGKAADAERPAAPVLGAPPAEMRELATTEDAHAAMLNRLNATLGPDPRARGED